MKDFDGRHRCQPDEILRKSINRYKLLKCILKKIHHEKRFKRKRKKKGG